MWRNMSYKRITDFDRLGLLLWKNYLLIIRTKSKIIALLGVPILFTLMFVAVRLLIHDESVDHQSYRSLHLFAGLVPQNESHLAFVSTNFRGAPKIMEDIEDLLKLNKSIEFFSEAALEGYLQSDRPGQVGGIVFRQSENELMATIRVAGLKTKLTTVQHWWNTDLLYPWQVEIPSRFPDSRTGGRVPGYVESGFMAIQNALSKAYLMKMGNWTDEDIPQIRIQRFSHPPYVVNHSLPINKIVLMVGTLIGFYFICLYNVKSIVIEKEMQFKVAMKMMGLGDFLHFCAWFIEFLLIFMLMVVVMICGWKFGSIFQHSHVGILLAVYLAYALAFCTFCFLLSSIFSKSATATIFILLIWAVTFIPYCLAMKQGRLCKYLAGLSLNTALFFFIDILYNREALEQGVNLSNYRDPEWFEKTIAVSDCVQMLIMDFFIYAIIAWYLNKVFPGEYGIPARWYFPFERLCLSRNNRPVFGTFELGEKYEKGPDGKLPVIKIIGLTKIYSNATVGLDGINMNIYDNEITVLLGENGAGKSTLLSVLTGLYPPTNGTAVVNDFDIRTHMDLIHESLGVCPQHNILFDLLTVEEHLIFFSKLKGCRKTEAKYEAEKYITQLDLKDKAEALVKTISMGMKRRLCLAIALCGDSKVILCDEPTAGMDPVARKAVWDLLQVEKATRIIMLSTHIMEEADVLADRVAILQNGKLKCSGTPAFLKDLYGGVKFKLSCEKTEHSDVEGITAMVNKYVPTATVAMEMASELSFKLDDAYRLVIPALLSDIEDNAGRLGLQGYGICLTGMEEVFFRVLLDNPESGHHHQHEGNKLTSPVEGLHNRMIFRSQVLGLLLKKFFYTKYFWLVLLVQLLVPPLLIFVMLRTITDPSEKFRSEPPLEITMNLYKNSPICVITPPASKLAEEYAWAFDDPPEMRMLLIEENIGEYFLNRIKSKDVPWMHMNHLVGASMKKGEPVIAWFNNQPYHGIPLTMDMLFGAMMRLACGNCSLRIVNHPLPELKGGRQNVNESKVQDVIADVLVLVIFDLAMFIMVAYYVIAYVKEQRSRVKLLQYISGISPFTFWLVTMIYDFMLIMVSIGLVLAVYVAEVRKTSLCINLLLVLMAYAVSILPFVYLRSFRYSNPTAAYLNILMLGIIFGTLVQFGVSKGGPYVTSDSFARNVTQVVLQLIPFYNLALATEHVWMSHDPAKSDWDFTMVYGMTNNVLIFLATGVSFFGLLMLNEANVWWLMTYAMSQRKVGTTNDASMDPDVIKERDYVATMGLSNVAVLNLVCQKLCKSYDDQLVVNDLSFTIEGSQCFGLLGSNGAGKTTLFKMLTGDEKVSSGEAWIRGKNLKKEMRKIYLETGYCPQEEALIEEFTGRETLKIFCLLKGISTDIVDQVSLEIAHNLGFLGHIDKKVKELSGGNRKKLSVALAMLNKPHVLLMDEPTSGLDPSAKRQMWKMINNHKEFGKSILLSSQSMEECEVLCTRLAILVNGQLKCIGTTQHLRARFADGFMLMVQINRTKSNLMEPGSELRIHKIEEFIYNSFPGAILQENYQGRLYYHIPLLQGMHWSLMFAKLESIRDEMDIESYSLRQLGLDHVFRMFTQSQLQDLRATS